MIKNLPNTTTSQISRELVTIREEGGAVALGRVLTLLVQTKFSGIEEAILAANEASRAHPCRIVVLADEDSTSDSEPRLDAEIRVGGDAGASEVVVLRAYGEAASDPESLVTGLLLPDAPVVAWWPGLAPVKPSVSAIGRIAQRRITDAASQPNPRDWLDSLADNYEPGDSDFAWTRLTLWRAQLAALLDQPPFDPITKVVVTGASDSPSTDLLAAWLGQKLGVEVERVMTVRGQAVSGIKGVKLMRASGDIEIVRNLPDVATLIQPSQPTRDINLPRRSLRDCLIEDLRRLDSDDAFGGLIVAGFGSSSSNGNAGKSSGN